MGRVFLIVIGLLISQSCSPSMNDTFNSEVLTSSKQEKIYINTLNWGLIDDYQISAVSSNENKVQKRTDTSNVVKGLEPFIYSFENDTLNLYFDGKVSYYIKEKFKTVHVNYIALNPKGYRAIQGKSYENKDGYHSVPKRKKQDYPSDMPKPPSN